MKNKVIGAAVGTPQKPSKIMEAINPDMYYTEIGIVEILPESTAINNGEAIMGEFYVLGAPITLVVGNTYTVMYNGVAYKSVASNITIPTIGEGIGLGDVAILSTGSPSGAYPFVLATADAISEMGASIAVIPLDGSVNVTVSISTEGTIVHQIPNKYLDLEWLPETKIVKGNEILPEVTVEMFKIIKGQYNYHLPNSPEPYEFEFVEGKEYIVNWRGKEYTVKGLDPTKYGMDADWGICIGDPAGYWKRMGVTADQIPFSSTGEPFLIFFDNNSSTSDSNGNKLYMANFRLEALDGREDDLTVSIYEVVDETAKLPSKFLPMDDIIQAVKDSIPTWEGGSY